MDVFIIPVYLYEQEKNISPLITHVQRERFGGGGLTALLVTHKGFKSEFQNDKPDVLEEC